MKKVAIFLIIATMTFVSQAQTTDPLNSNYLINQGVSPRVLDFAANSSLQDGSMKENVSVTVRYEGKEKAFQLQSTNDSKVFPYHCPGIQLV